MKCSILTFDVANAHNIPIAPSTDYKFYISKRKKLNIYIYN